THTGPGMVYVLEGSITLAGAGPIVTYNAGDLFLDPANRQGLIYRNRAGKVTATLLMFHVSDPKAPLQNPPMMPYVAIQELTFIKASQASFAQDNDLVIGVAHESTAKAYPALLLAQTGSV